MSARAWIYVWSVLVLGAVLSALTLSVLHPATAQWTTFAALTILATVAQLGKVEAPNHQTYFATPIFIFAGVLLLPPFLVVLLITIPHLIEWAKERWTDSPLLRKWYLQPFNIAKYVIAGCGAHGIYATLISPDTSLVTQSAVVAVTTAGVTFVALNQVLLSLVLVLARGVPLRDSGALDAENLQAELVLVCLGYVVAVLWQFNPLLVVPALSPLLLIYRAFMIPQLKQDAQIDGKTGLFNARHFTTIFTAELDRARRFDRPLAFIMADLDFLRDINNTYGHLAGDTVLAGIGQIIRQTIREFDVAGRFGGEEFALVVPEADPDEAEALAERIRQAVEAAEFAAITSPTPIRATLSLGIACYPRDAMIPTELIQAADVAVYQAKSEGRNRVVSVTDVPQEIRDRQTPAEGRLVAATLAAHTASTEPAATPETKTGTSTMETAGASHPSDAQRMQGILKLFVGSVIAAGAVVTVFNMLHGVPASPDMVGLLVILAVIAELLQVDLYGRGAVSISMSLAFAAALLTGVSGLAIVSAAIAAAHHLRQGRRGSQLHHAAFNWATHVLAGLAPVLLVGTQHIPVQMHNLLQLALPATAAAIGYYAIETACVASALSMAEGTSTLLTWRTQYRWLAGHYLVLCLMGLVLSIAYSGLGSLGIIVFTLPVFMMHFVQKQYIMQTRESVRALQRLNRDLSRATLTDSLTRLGNHRAFQQELHRELERAARRGETVTLARIDLDEFKVINERHGHRYGDRLLTALGAVLRSGRAADGAFHLAADEFALILPYTTLADAVTVTERLRQAAEGSLGGATVSIGVATLPVGQRDIDLLHEQADAALAEAKRRGRNIIVTFDEVKESVDITSSAQAHAIHRLLTGRQVGVAFQPIWDLTQNGILAYEALIRPAPSYGLAGPQEAFSIAERLGRAHDLDTICREAILARAAELPRDALLFLNVSPQTLDHDVLAGSALLDAVAEAGLTPDRVVLELTERSMARLNVVVREAKRLRALGFRLALDDTGAGNAGLEMLSQLPVDFVKIDRGVVAKALTNTTARAVLAGIIAIARVTNTYVIAEGIETSALLNLVREVSMADAEAPLGIQGVQGYLLGRPDIRLMDTAAVSEHRAALLSGQRQSGRGLTRVG